jgi:glucose-1-phosphate cytidylyltransferase
MVGPAGVKAVILAGGAGTRLAEETTVRPKPMVEIGGRPILWHIMKIYSHFGVTDFVICLGYKGHTITEYFANYFLHSSDVSLDISNQRVTVHKRRSENWHITLVDTGLETMTGSRIKAVRSYLDPKRPFFMTYGDGVGDVDIGELLAFHRRHGKLATVTAVAPPGRFGVLDIEAGKVKGFREKIASDQYRINGGFFVLDPNVIDLIQDQSTTWEQQPMHTLAERGELMAYEHNGFWQPMDTLRDKHQLEELWNSGGAPWVIWAKAG